MPPQPGRPWGQTAGVVVGVVAGFWVLGTVPLHAAPGRLLGAGPGLVLALAPYLATLSLDTLGWQWLLRAAGPEVSFLSLLRIRLSAEAVGLPLPSAGLAQEWVALRALLTGHGVPVALGLGSLAARRFALIRAHGIVLAVGTALLFSAATSARDQGLSGVLAIAALSLGAVGHWGPRSPLVLSLADRAERSLHLLPGRRLRSWAERHRHEVGRSGRVLATITGTSGATAWTASLAFLLFYFSEALESLVMLRLLGSRIDFAQVLSFDSAVGLGRSLVAFVPAGLGVQEAGYATFLLGAGERDALGLAAAFVVLKRFREAVYCVLGLALLASTRPNSRRVAREPAHPSPLRLRLPQPDHPDA